MSTHLKRPLKAVYPRQACAGWCNCLSSLSLKTTVFITSKWDLLIWWFAKGFLAFSLIYICTWEASSLFPTLHWRRVLLEQSTKLEPVDRWRASVLARHRLLGACSELRLPRRVALHLVDISSSRGQLGHSPCMSRAPSDWLQFLLCLLRCSANRCCLFYG